MMTSLTISPMISLIWQVFRDLAQGAFRMRGISDGQQITLLIIPEVFIRCWPL
jgi:hypothetical protein